MDYPPPSILSPQSPAANLNVFRPRRSDDWHEYREIIEQLYRTDQLKLRDVKRIMERDYQFYASEKQYKDRLAAWHVRKNIKAQQVELMVRKKHKRAARGKQTAFRLNGQEVDPKRIARFVRRYGASWEKQKQKDQEAEMRSPEPETPSDMSCYTPEPAEDTATSISSTEIQSPTRETSTYPLHYDPTHLESIPDLVIDEEQQHHQQRQQHYPLDLHSNLHPAPPLPRLHPPEPFVHSLAQHVAHPHLHPQVHVQPRPPGAPTSTTLRAQGHTLDTAQAQGESIPPSDTWNRLDTFQNRLAGLQFTLDRTMSPWARDQDPNQEISHHEGLGM